LIVEGLGLDLGLNQASQGHHHERYPETHGCSPVVRACCQSSELSGLVVGARSRQNSLVHRRLHRSA
jgi:hypothetical protein